MGFSFSDIFPTAKIWEASKDIVSGLTGEDAADAALKAAGISAASQTEALNYLKEINALPTEYRDKAMTLLSGAFGIGGDTSSQQELVSLAKSSPLYSEIMGGLKEGEQSILRNAGATGGLRSGNVQSNLADYGTQLSNKALTTSYNNILSGLQGMAGYDTGSTNIANLMTGIGATQASGVTAAANAKTQALQNLLNTGLGVAGLMI